jgi:predicted ATPase
MHAESMRRLEIATLPAPSSFESTTFIGRERELRDLAALAARERLVTISGQPGAGKSRLTLRYVRSVAAAHRDGAIIINAASASDTEALRRALDQRLASRAPSLPGNSAEDLVAGLDAVVLLDGCERITSACAEFVRRLLAAAPDIRVIASSRIPLGLAGEAVFRLGPLADADAARLFVERVRVARSDFPMRELDTSSVERICGKLDGLPLAIELAAARARVSTLAQVEVELRDSADRPGRDVLFSAYASSYDLLNETERAMLRRLAAFANGWNAAVGISACSDLAPASELAAAATKLVEHSLVDPPGVAEVGARYTMLATTRDFARDRARTLGLAEADARATALAIGRYYTAIGTRLRAEHAANHYPEVERDRENIEAALATLWSGDAADRELATDLSLAISRYWMDQGFARDGARWLRRALDDLAPEASPKRLELLRVIGTMTRNLGDYASSFRDFAELVRLHESAHSSPIEVAKAQTLAANAARMMGDFDEAMSRTQVAYASFAAAGDVYLAGWAIYALGTTLLSAGRFTAARVELERATAMFNEAGAIADSSSSIANLALCHYYEGRLETAYELTRESLQRATSVGHRYYYAHAALNEALILRALAEGERAWRLVIEVSEIGVTLGATDVAIACAEVAAALLADTEPAVAAFLLGAVDSARERARAPRFPIDLPLYEDIEATLRSALGDELSAASRARGRVTPLSDAVGRLAQYDRGGQPAPRETNLRRSS